jgi:hypothetical protein
MMQYATKYIILQLHHLETNENFEKTTFQFDSCTDKMNCQENNNSRAELMLSTFNRQK